MISLTFETLFSDKPAIIEAGVPLKLIEAMALVLSDKIVAEVCYNDGQITVEPALAENGNVACELFPYQQQSERWLATNLTYIADMWDNVPADFDSANGMSGGYFLDWTIDNALHTAVTLACEVYEQSI